MPENANASGLEELSAYQAYQRNVRRSETLQSEILRGAKAGESPFALLLKAAEAISAMTGDDVFLNEIRTSITAVYGWALGESAPLEMELEETRQRLEKITAAMAQTADVNLKHGMDLAARAHRAKIAELEQKLGISQET